MSSIRVAINGFGRIGRNAFKIAFAKKDIEIVAINDLTDNATLAHLLRHDSNYGHYHKKVSSDDKNLIVDDKKIKVLAEKDPSLLPWKEMDIDVVIESTGFFTTREGLEMHIKAGAKKVVLSAPEKKDDAGHEKQDTFVFGANHQKIPADHKIISNASCTTNCIAPIMAVLSKEIGIEKSMMTTIHSYTASQVLQDGPNKDLREARSAAENIVPTTTGAAIAAALTVPELEGNITFLAKRDISAEEINKIIIKACKSTHKGIIDYTEEELVSRDFIGDPHSCIVDTKLTKVVAGNLCKVVAWYDNEWGYSNRLVEMVEHVGKLVK